MIIYYLSSHYNSSFRDQLFPLLKPFIKSEGFTNFDRKTLYGVSDTDFVFVDNIADAQVVILPMSWNYYTKTNQLPLAYDLVKEAEQHQKVVWSMNTGDFGVKVPSFKNLIVFRQGGYTTNTQYGHHGYPSIVADYLIKNKLDVFYLKSIYNIQPIVGFCGQANASKKNALIDMFKIFIRNFKSQLGLSGLEQQKVLSTSFLRAHLLNSLEASRGVISYFIRRKAYRAGVKKEKETHETTKEFYQNILDSQYVLCVRGAGNFSVRFYETLMMGRIPLYVHTDGYLPLNDIIDWKEHVVWVDYKERHNIVPILLDFHQQLNQETLLAMFKSNRKLWEEKLTLSGFFEQVRPKTLWRTKD